MLLASKRKLNFNSKKLKSDATGVFETTKLRFLCSPLCVMRSEDISSSLCCSHLPSACTQRQLTQKLNIGQILEEFQGLVKKTALRESSHPFSANLKCTSASDQLCDLICGEFVSTKKKVSTIERFMQASKLVLQ